MSDDRVAVDAAVDAVLVLDDHDVGVVQDLHRLHGGSSLVVVDVGRDDRRGDVARSTPDPHDADIGAALPQPVAQRGGERGDATGRRRETGQDGDAARRPDVLMHTSSSRQLG